MNLNFLCCIGAELKNSTYQTTRMTQIYLYRAYESETVDDMLAPGFFDAAMGIIRKDDLLLLYGPNDEKARYVYARVSEIDRDGVVIEKVEIDAKDIYVDTDDMSNLHAHTLQDVITEIDAEITRLDDRIDEEIARAKAAEGNLILPVITDGATAPTNLSEAVRQLNTQNIATITADDQAPTPGKWTLWAAIKKCFANIVNFFAELTVVNSRLNALEGRGGPVGARDFGKTFTNPITGADAQEILTAMVDDIWPGHTAITWNDPLSSSSFTDADGVNRTMAEIFNATWIRNSYDGTRIVLANTPDTIPPVFSLQNVGVDVVGYANETTAGIVRVGSGSQMVVNPTTGDISLNGAKASGIRSTIGALASNQGSSNSGLILGIDGSGNVVPTESSSGGRNIGDIFLSARTNTGTAVNGAVLCNGARYNFSDINQGQNNIQALLNNGSIQSFSMAEYNAAVNSRLYVTPTFVSNSTDDHVVSDARGNSDIYTVFNGVGSKQIGNWSTYWIQEKFPTNVFINSYSITADNKTNAEYPSTWELQGSNNGSSWDSLDLQNNLEFYIGETKTFPVYLSKSYKYYRLVFIDGAESGGNGELGRVHFNVRQSSSIGYFGYDSGASYFKVPNLMDDNGTVMLSPSDFETFYHDAFFAGPQSLFLQSTAIPRALSTVILKPYVQLFNGATDDAVATCTQALQQIANIQQTLNGMDYPIYWDADDSGDHSHSKPGVPVPANHGWYRIYKSGWVEQGGKTGNPNNGCILVTLPIAMESNYFTALASGNTSGNVANYTGVVCERRSSTQIAICATGQQANGCSWRVSGYAA